MLLLVLTLLFYRLQLLVLLFDKTLALLVAELGWLYVLIGLSFKLCIELDLFARAGFLPRRDLMEGWY